MPTDLDDTDLLACALALRGADRMREPIFQAPAWDILLDLFIAQCRGVSPLRTALCPDLPVATVDRTIVALGESGYVTTKARRSTVLLTDAGRQAVRIYLAAVAQNRGSAPSAPRAHKILSYS